ncbi:MAG: hypothetical protein JWN76_1857 [Chitinophagaceae bacterium]|nr:hypothetical protein [Chitinophagaceae bacterium]
MLQQFNSICEFRQQNPGTRGSGLTMNDPVLIPVKKDLEELKNSLRQKFENYRGFHFSFEVSHGQSYYPSILHVSILPPGQSVSKGIYLVICFDILGRGALVGCAESVTQPQGLNTTKRKKRNVELRINVDGLRSTTKYNDAFENPKEFYYGTREEAEFLSHIELSLDLALYHLGLGDSPHLRIEDKVVAGINEPEFDPSNLLDARTKIAKQITARRGQKKFRKTVLKAYNGKCAVTGSDVEPVLEAAHIVPYKGLQTNHIKNGILLRSDIHLLFDLGLLTVEWETMKIKVHSSLSGTYYFQFNDVKIYLPTNTSDYPHPEALKHHSEVEFKRV